MDLQLWAELSAAISDVRQRFAVNPRDTHDTERIIRVHLWSVLHDRPTCWACEPRNWTDGTRPGKLPRQSRMSRRVKRPDFEQFFTRLSERLAGHSRNWLLKVVDGKTLELSHNTTDPDAAWGRGVSRIAKRYKLHALCSGNDLPDAFIITPLNVCEKKMAARMIKRIHREKPSSGGYLLADSYFNAS